MSLFKNSQFDAGIYKHLISNRDGILGSSVVRNSSSSLDGQKAYDSVPFKSIIQALKRIKVPEIFIKNVIKILQRNVYSETPAGKTNILNAQRGLPQGDPMSPILWNIFYDELLLQQVRFIKCITKSFLILNQWQLH